MVENDRYISERIASGDKKTFEGVFKEYYTQLVLFARNYIDQIEDAEEIVQQLFFNLWNKRKTLSINQSIKSYLYNSVRNNCFDFLKHEKVKAQYAGVVRRQQTYENNSTNKLIEKETISKVYQAVEMLPEKTKMIFKMNRFEGLKYREIAEKLDISQKTVENQMGIALKKLREMLKDYHFNKK